MVLWKRAPATHQGDDTIANTLFASIVESRGVVIGPVVPDRYRVLLPLEPDLEVVIELYEVEEVLEDRVGLVLSHTDDALREVRVDKDGLPAGDGVRPVMQVISERALGRAKALTYRMTGWTASRWSPTLPGEPRSPVRSMLGLASRVPYTYRRAACCQVI